jgi:probable nitrogen fixation protein
MPIIANPDEKVVGRVRAFYGSVGLAIEQQTGVMASPIMEMSSEGFGRIAVIAGRLVLHSKTLRDVHRFGFETLDALAADGAKLVAGGVNAINEYPDLARA